MFAFSWYIKSNQLEGKDCGRFTIELEYETSSKAPTGSDIESVIILSENPAEFLNWLQLDQSKIAEMHLIHVAAKKAKDFMKALGFRASQPGRKSK